MADLAIGVSKTALDALVNKVKSAITADAELRQAVERDMVFIKEEFEMMQSFLDATNGGRIKCNVEKTWVRQVWDLSYDTEDCIEFVVHLDTKQSWTKWLLRLRPSCMAAGAPLPINQAVADIRLLKARVEDVSLRSTRYHISNSGSTPVEQMQKTLADSSSTALDIFVSPRETEEDLVTFSQLKTSITTADEALRVMSVCGTGVDIGRTTIIRKVYEDSEICSEFKCRAWVKLVFPFNSREFIRNLVDQFYTNSHQKPGLAMSGPDVVVRMHDPADTFVKQVVDQVNTERYLMILEDLSSMAQWDAVRAYLPDMKNGSRIVVSTHQLEIASLCVGQPYEVRVIRRFSTNHTIRLFLKDIERSNVDSQATSSKCDNGQDSEAKKLEDKIAWACRKFRSCVVSVLVKAGDEKSIFVGTVYDSCKLEDKFDDYACVHVSQQFDIKVLCQDLLSEFQSSSDEADPVKKCQYIMHQKRCLVVIFGLESEKHWDSIKTTLQSEASISFIIVVTSEKNVATYCARNGSPDSAESDEAPYFLEDKGTQVYNKTSTMGHPSSVESATQWLENFRLQWRDSDLEGLEQKINSARSSDTHHVISLWGSSGIGKSTIVKTVYSRCIRNGTFEKYAWVDAPGKDSSVGLSKSLSLKVCQGEAGKCQDLLNQHCWLIVIDQLTLKNDWDYTKNSLSLGTSRSCIVVVTSDESLARYCATKDDEVCHMKDLDSDVRRNLSKEKGIEVEQKMPVTLDISTSGHPPFRENAIRWLKNFCLHGRESETNQLELDLKLASISKAHHVVSVWGTAGVGKSVLVRTVFYRCMVEEIFEKYAWVHVPQGFDMVEFCQNIGSELSPERCTKCSVRECLDLLHQHRCLIVMDRLELKGVWEIVRAHLSLGNSRSCIVVVTRAESVARHCATTDQQVHHVKDLQSEAALDLFKGKEIGEAGTSDCDHKTMLEEAKLFLNMCGRFCMEAANALRGYVTSQTDMSPGQAMKHLNANIMQELLIKPELRQLKDSLAQTYSSFCHCHHVLKRCTFYLTIFQDSIIRRNRLVRRWIAEGYSEGTDSKSKVDNAKRLLSELVADLGIIGEQPQISATVAAGKRMTSYQVYIYSLVLKYIISRETEESILLPLEISVLEGGNSLKRGRVGQHLSSRSSWTRDEYVYGSLDFSRLRSLTVSGEWKAFFISDKMRVLRVLDLEGTTNVEDKDLEEIGNMLPRLKFLSLRGCTTVSNLPDSLGDLRQLQTIDIRDTRVIKVPRSIIRLQNLQYFRARTAAARIDDDDGMVRGRTVVSSWFITPSQGQVVRNLNGVTMPRGIGRLTALRKLGVVSADAGGEALLAELHNLKQLEDLHVLSVHRPRRNMPNMFSLFSGEPWNIRFPQNLMKLNLDMPRFCLSREYTDAIGKLKKMHTLRLHVQDIQGGVANFLRCMHERVDARTSLRRPFGQLKLIKIDCINDSLPATYYEDATLEQPKLSLEKMLDLSPNDMQNLGMLKGLYTLCLRFLSNHAPVLLYVYPRVQDATFDELKVLEISFSSELKVKFERVMNDLEQLKFDCLDASELQLLGLEHEHLPSLKEVWFKGSLNDELKSNLERQLANHPNRPVLKLEQ